MKTFAPTIDVTGLSLDAVRAVHAAVLHAQQHRDTSLHTVTLSEFNALVDFPTPPARTKLIGILSEAHRASFSLPLCHDELGGAGAWPDSNLVLSAVAVSHSHVMFKVSSELLNSLEP